MMAAPIRQQPDRFVGHGDGRDPLAARSLRLVDPDGSVAGTAVRAGAPAGDASAAGAPTAPDWMLERLLAQSYLFDDPGAYEAGVRDAIGLVRSVAEHPARGRRHG